MSSRPKPTAPKPDPKFVEERRAEEKGGATEEKSSSNPIQNCWAWVSENLGWIGTGKNYGLIALNVSPGGTSFLYESVMNMGGDFKEGLLKCAFFKDAAGPWKGDTDPNKVGEICNTAAKSVGSLKLFGACGPNNGLVEVSVGPQSMPLAYVSVYKPGMGLVTSQTFGSVAGFSKDGEGNVVGLTTEDADGNKFVKYPPAPTPCGGD
ncbi:hypothetical protein EMIHUDRAFT_437447 [Emiliania huxleyi CCMP1516]|uniref:Uncharacterized protein n=3 Tax=Emiliania huxleyi TaxID=2903 RepID=A0A0D3ILS9_EMIH1|nr:hypothetical protein EMIHUDRAFT_437447 [Emiliania huxleyi CCMP1516]EOD12214.1 hypothetical protein EMIHUDRAFT_437447 [Emiliania huxleyi CCMP1516]|mmetsp:Transcript_653/g.2086  ORF Transcript_653/g.2086 Transcript_653/m.2086 type:complete len:207 (-) Transcript_653:190-810(-)|eukprot:XP_005764643.1 hypothetical protein EMIHUDRAFT_437447 [Emiliania huxleyi CCMP1516]